MRNKRIIDLVEMVNNFNNRMITEDIDASQYTKPNIPIQIRPIYEGDKFYMYVNIFDLSRLPQLGNFKKDMLRNYKHKNGVNQNAELPSDMQKLFNATYWTQIKKIHGKECLAVRLMIDKPMELLSEDGKSVNQQSSDVRKIFDVIIWLAKGFEVPVADLRNETQYTIRRLYFLAKNMYTEEVENELNANEANFFFQICRKIGEPETLQMFNEIKIYDGEKIVDHQFWPGNVLRIMAQAANYGTSPTYLATELQWEDMGRRVVNFDRPYRGITFNGGRVGQKEIERRLSDQGKSMAAMNEESRYSKQTLRGGTAETNRENGRGSFSWNSPYYDVEDTVVVGEDEWSNSYGFKNNLTGELNDYTKNNLDISQQSGDEKNDRINRLNKALGTEDYSGVDLTYQAVCKVAKVRKNNILPQGTSDDEKINQCNRMIHDMLVERLSSFENGGGNIALNKNYEALAKIGTIIVKRFVGLPMNGAPAIPNLTQDMTNVLSTHVKEVATDIVNQKMKIAKQSKQNMNEAIEYYSPFFVFEETFNNTIKILKEYVEK